MLSNYVVPYSTVFVSISSPKSIKFKSLKKHTKINLKHGQLLVWAQIELMSTIYTKQKGAQVSVAMQL